MSAFWDPARLDPFSHERAEEHANGTCAAVGCNEGLSVGQVRAGERFCRNHRATMKEH